MSLKMKRIVIALLGTAFLASLLFVQWMEVIRKQEEAGLIPKHIVSPEGSERCVDCHAKETPGIVEQWKGSRHAEKGIGCFECHEAKKGDVDGFNHEGAFIATLVTPRDCSTCHPNEFKEFTASHHAKAGNILHSLDNNLAEVVEGAQAILDVHAATPGRTFTHVDGRAFAYTGCQQCHGSKVAFQSTGDGTISVTELKPDADGQPTNKDAVARIKRNDDGKPLFFQETWPNTGIGRLNLDGSIGACSACHSRHDFSPRRARQPENCGKCHLGPDHPQKEVYEESKHGIAYRDLKDKMNLDADNWVLGKD
ncbi:MAG: multiheme c-type cytochrome, partial [Thermoguttaceae bacterium]